MSNSGFMVNDVAGSSREGTAKKVLSRWRGTTGPVVDRGRPATQQPGGQLHSCRTLVLRSSSGRSPTSGKAERLALKDQTVTMDVPPSIMRPPMSLGAGPWCQRGHPVLGGGLPLLILPEAMERGLYGELNLLPVTVLTPCVLQYSNLATRVTRIQISFINHITHIIYPCFGG
ncbi:uncharacterized protein isoform X2 [Salmo salar]|uniref:Uncharacterized protein isoform X2 n=1 Tax=Salmo salar TaxID=8030 RepID=A0ABM3F9Y0_SALSA|nr:uncharacterized protein LOC123744668 isoform X2 [Salmo salar]